MFSHLANASGFALIILLLLLLFSLLSWTIILRKWMTFRAVAQKSHDFLTIFRKSPRLSEIGSACDLYHGTPLAGIFSAGYQELNTQLQAAKSHNPERPVLSDRNVVGIQRALQRAATAELSVLEKSMSWLATTASVTPFIGLLGTVVGIINAFTGLSQEGTASIRLWLRDRRSIDSDRSGFVCRHSGRDRIQSICQQDEKHCCRNGRLLLGILNLVERSFS